VSNDLNSLYDLIEHYNPKHSAFQINNFMVGRQPTLWGAFRQALRELFPRYFELDRKTGPNDLSVQSIEEQIDMAHRKREFCHLFLIAQKLKAQLGPLTPQRVEELEAEYWVARLRDDAVMDLMGHGRVTRETLEAISNLPIEPRAKLFTEISEHSHQLALIESFQNRENFTPVVTHLEINELVPRTTKLIEDFHSCSLIQAT